MPRFSATHALANRYVGGEGLVYHRDIYANDGDGRAPIVNVCLGAPCRFGLRHVDENGSRGRTRELTLDSGDALVFGGACRFIEHGVLSVDLDQAPAWMADDPSRVSLTFREAPSVLGCEEYFRTFSTGGSFADEQVRWREGDALLGAPPQSEAYLL
jgi:alkylated DNA repair protein (DNA oxidative demethylase)